jgi:membrane-associated phospholipid phosphatase
MSALSHQNVLASGESTINLETAIDAYIPLVPEFVWVYYLFPLGLILPAILRIPIRSFLHYCIAFTVCFSTALIAFYEVPVLIDYQPITCNSLSCDALRFLRTTDIGNNLIPSLHAALSLVALMSLYFSGVKVKNIPLWLSTLPLYGGVIVSTVLVKQHYFVDVPAGLAWALASWYIAHLIIKRINFTDAKHIA